jgi:hypothetical protein
MTIAQTFLERIRLSEGRFWQASFRINLGDSLCGRNNPGDFYQAQQDYQEELDFFVQIGADGYVQGLKKGPIPYHPSRLKVQDE